MTISSITLLPIDNPHAVGTDFGIGTNALPVTDNKIELLLWPEKQLYQMILKL